MIGIYMYTNKLNNKKYVGQSIHCGKRFDQHFKGKQLIDDIIQLEGIENFNFEILKQVDKPDLSYWEDYYILKHNTMFPNGYNKRWNCSAAIREQIQEVLEEEGRFAAETPISVEQYSNLKALGFSILPEFSLFPSSTLEKLVSTFKLNELELKLYVICYRYNQAGKRLQYNSLTCGHLKEHLDYPQCPDDETILQALTSLNEKGLIELGKESPPCRRTYDIDKSVEGWEDIEQRLAAIDVSRYYEIDSTSFHVKKDFETPPVAHPNQLIYTIHKSKTKEGLKSAFEMIEKENALEGLL